MFFTNARFRLCELFGIPLYLDPSLGLLLLFFALGGAGPGTGLACAAMLLVSVTLHELGHALTARAFGFQTRDITLSLLGGCASLIALPRKASQEFLTAIAGPAVSFALACAGTLLVALVSENQGVADAFLFTAEETLASFGLQVSLGASIYIRPDNYELVSFLLYFTLMNTMLGVFNLLPGFPMDGGRVFRSAMRRFMTRVEATRIAMIVGRVTAVFIGLRGAWNLLHGGNWGFATLMIAWTIWKEGMREYMLATQESGWSDGWFSARVSPPPYGGKSEDAEIERTRN